MRSPENFVLKWKDFGDNIFSSFQELRRSSDFSDVTLVSSEGGSSQADSLLGKFLFQGGSGQPTSASSPSNVSFHEGGGWC